LDPRCGQRRGDLAARLRPKESLGMGRYRALMGSDRPRASLMQAMVDGLVPITMQVQTEGASLPVDASISLSSISPARYFPAQPADNRCKGAQHLTLVWPKHHRSPPE